MSGKKQSKRLGSCICPAFVKLTSQKGSEYFCDCTASILSGEALRNHHEVQPICEVDSFDKFWFNQQLVERLRRLRPQAFNPDKSSVGEVAREKASLHKTQSPSASPKSSRKSSLQSPETPKSAWETSIYKTSQAILASIEKEKERKREEERERKREEEKERERRRVREREEGEKEQKEEVEKRESKRESESESDKAVVQVPVVRRDPSPFKMATALAEIPKDLRDALEAVLKQVDHFDMKDLAGVMETYRYQGFDVEAIREVFLRRYNALQRGTILKLSDIYSFEIGGPENLSKMISFLAFLFDYRGNNLQAIEDGLDGDYRAPFKFIVTGLQIKAKVMEKGKKTKSKDTLTLARIAAVFPLSAINVVTQNGYNRKVIDMSEVGLDQASAASRIMCHPMVASILMAKHKNASWPFVTFLAALKLNDLIGPKEKQSGQAILQYHLAALESKAVSKELKKAFWENNSLPSDSIIASCMEIVGERVAPPVYQELVDYCKNARE